MELLLANYRLTVFIIVLVGLVSYSTYKFMTQPSSKQKEQIKQVLLILVTEAEKLFGGQTGRLKLSYVYSELITKLPYLRYVPLSIIEKLIEEVLEEMRHLLETNPKVAEIVKDDIK